MENFTKKKEKKRKEKKNDNKLIWHWGLDFKNALMICVMWGEILYLQIATWLQNVLNLLALGLLTWLRLEIFDNALWVGSELIYVI